MYTVTKVNNEIRQDGNTGEMNGNDELIEEISKYVALHPEILLQLVHQQALVQVCNHLNFYNQVMKLK